MLDTTLMVVAFLASVTLLIWSIGLANKPLPLVDGVGCGEIVLAQVLGIPLGIVLAIYCGVVTILEAEAWSVHNWVQDVRTGSSWSMGPLSPEKRNLVYQSINNNFELTVAEPPEDPACEAKWPLGRTFYPEFDGGDPWRVTVVGRATHPAGRYLVTAEGKGIDGRCGKIFLIGALDLSKLKQNWKAERLIKADGHSDTSVLGEVASVKAVH